MPVTAKDFGRINAGYSSIPVSKYKKKEKKHLFNLVHNYCNTTTIIKENLSYGLLVSIKKKLLLDPQYKQGELKII